MPEAQLRRWREDAGLRPKQEAAPLGAEGKANHLTPQLLAAVFCQRFERLHGGEVTLHGILSTIRRSGVTAGEIQLAPDSERLFLVVVIDFGQDAERHTIGFRVYSPHDELLPQDYSEVMESGGKIVGAVMDVSELQVRWYGVYHFEILANGLSLGRTPLALEIQRAQTEDNEIANIIWFGEGPPPTGLE